MRVDSRETAARAISGRRAMIQWGEPRDLLETAESRLRMIVDRHENSWFVTSSTAATAAAAGDATSVLAPTTRATTDDVIVAIPRNLGASVNS